MIIDQVTDNPVLKIFVQCLVVKGYVHFLNKAYHIVKECLMRMDKNIQYLNEVCLRVYSEKEVVSENAFSIESSLLIQEDIPQSELVSKNLMPLEISTSNVVMDLDKSLVKSTDFLQRCAYRYDGLQIGVDDANNIVIKNEQDLSRQWAAIRSLLQSDYKGGIVDDYLMRINNTMVSPEVYGMPTNNYFYYGLMFVGTPYDTSAGWSRKQQVMLSDFDDVIFEETLRHEKNLGDSRCFSITGKALGEPKDCRVNKFYGRTQISTGSLFPDWVQLEVDYTKEDRCVYWKYELTRQEEE